METSILMTTEGTYPFHAGGVSKWCDDLIRELDEFSFTIFAVMMNPYSTYKYDMRRNVSHIIRCPLWGIEEPTEYMPDKRFSEIFLNKMHTSNHTIKEIFLPLLRKFLWEIYNSEIGAETAGQTLYEMYLYFHKYDYENTFKSMLVWDCFYEEMLTLSNIDRKDNKDKEDTPKIYNFTEALRWLYRFLIILVPDIPKTDLTHSTGAAFCSIPCIISKLKYGTPFLLTEHGVYMREQYIFVSKAEVTYYSKKFLLNLITLIVRMSYHYADQISPVCNYNVTWELLNNAKKEKIKPIYNGIEPEAISPKTVGYRPYLTVVSATRVDPLKDIETLIRAASLVHKEMPNVKFVVYGSLNAPEYHKRCLKLIRSLDINDIFTFAGHSDDLDHIYGEGDIIALSSLSEAFPYTIIEAMMCGKPIVATDVGGVKEALEGCGVIVKPKDPEAFAQALLQLLKNDELRNTLGNDARQKALNTFTLERTINQYRESYLNLIRNHHN